MNSHLPFPRTTMLLCAVAISALPLLSVPRQHVLVEHFTNTSCGPCATYNPAMHAVLNSMTRDTAIKVSYHVWWPGSDDPFYQFNTGDVQSRVNYYGVSGVPDIFADYVQHPSMDNPTAIRNAIRARYNTASPCTIELWASPAGATTVHFVARVNAAQDMTGSNYRAYAALISDVIAYNAPNGETSFPDPFRDIYPNANPGQPFTIANGQSFELEGLLNRQAGWAPENLTVVAWVQSTTNREILQCEWVDVLTTSGSVSVTAPNGGETWFVGETNSVTWTSSGFSENVRVQINRTFPTGLWESITSSTPNDGSQSWTVTGAATTTARVRVTGASTPLVGDSSDANFTLAQRTITIVSPNGIEEWTVGSLSPIVWTSQHITGNVRIELNRDYPSGSWELLDAGTPNDGSFDWVCTAPTTSIARVRLTSLNYPAVEDVSDANFRIVPRPNVAPVLWHDPLDDQLLTSFAVTCWVEDDAPGVTVRMFYRFADDENLDSLAFSATGNLNEYAGITTLASGSYEYVIEARDVEGLAARTDTLPFKVGFAGGTVIAYDDGSAEASQWAFGTENRWAVKFDPTQTPFILCGATVGVSALHPDTTHSRLQVQVHLPDGFGLPGPPIGAANVGSLGNVIGGVPTTQDNLAMVILRDAFGDPFTVNGSFFISVTNASAGTYEAFLHDTSSAQADRSYYYDSCDLLWISELSGHPSARPGNRMIRASGFALIPPTITAIRNGNDIRLRWNATGAPYYKIYSATTVGGPFDTLEGSTADTLFSDAGAVALNLRFYTVHASTAP